jgi:hypothetical protein
VVLGLLGEECPEEPRYAPPIRGGRGRGGKRPQRDARALLPPRIRQTGRHVQLAARRVVAAGRRERKEDEE